jgi:hypothetical protein
MGRADDVTVLRLDPSQPDRAGAGAGTTTAPRVLKQRFVLDEKLGSGGMGTVFRAKDLRKVEARDRHPYVAVKVLNNDFREHPEAFIALQREAAKSQALSHRNIVSIYDFDKDGDVPFIIMELLEGQELADLLRAYPTGMPDEMVWKIARCMCEGLEHAHEAGLVHADFKPGNVFVAPSHSAKILDFGIARAVQLNQQDSDADDDVPRPVVALTPAYASAEMLDRQEPEVRDDLFSLGVVLYLMLTGTHPYERIPANEARDRGLRPARPRRLSRRQWRTLERCLAFRRADRPASVDAIKTGLFQPSPWRSRTALVAGTAVLLTFTAAALKEEAAVQEATVAVRQTTLVDSQIARLEALLAASTADAEWEGSLAREVEVLRSLLPPGIEEPSVLTAIRERFQALILADLDRDQAVARYRRALSYGALPAADAHLAYLLRDDVYALLDGARLDLEWMDRLERALGRFATVYPGSSQLAALRVETVDVLVALLDTNVGAERFPVARRALAFMQTHEFDAELLERMGERVTQAERRYQNRELVLARQEALQRFEAELADALAGPCLRFDPAPAAAVFDGWTRRYPAFAQPGRERVGAHVARCLGQLEALDRNRAADLQQRVVALFGPLPGVVGVRDDPCAADYLVDNGRQGGRAGTCADRIGETGQGPRLVVVSGVLSGERFAITRQEIGWADLAGYCADGGECPSAGQPDLPVAGVPIGLAQGYARWLSERTGFRYTLPSYAQWRRAAEGSDDPNRNCQVRLGSVRRGLAPVAVGAGASSPLGLLNVLGNVQEWVIDDGVIKAAGGAFTDPIAACTVDTLRPHDGAPDSATGFRLVREVS